MTLLTAKRPNALELPRSDLVQGFGCNHGAPDSPVDQRFERVRNLFRFVEQQIRCCSDVLQGLSCYPVLARTK
jgi:hypothetical protein